MRWQSVILLIALFVVLGLAGGECEGAYKESWPVSVDSSA